MGQVVSAGLLSETTCSIIDYRLVVRNHLPHYRLQACCQKPPAPLLTTGLLSETTCSIIDYMLVVRYPDNKPVVYNGAGGF
jgi:hypothetical protein